MWPSDQFEFETPALTLELLPCVKWRLLGWLLPQGAFSQGCGAGTQMSGSSSWHPIFLAPPPTSGSFGLQNDFVRWKQKKTIVFFVKLACPTN